MFGVGLVAWRNSVDSCPSLEGDSRQCAIDHVIWLVGYVRDYNADITLEDVLSVKAKTPEGRQMVQSAAEILREQGREQGRSEGREQGRWEVREQVALNLLREGMAPETIAEVTELSPAKIENLRHTNNSG